MSSAAAIAALVARYGSNRSSPLLALLLLIGLAVLPWIFQADRNRSSLVGASPMDEAAERFWRRFALVAIPLLVIAAFIAKGLGWFESWTRW